MALDLNLKLTKQQQQNLMAAILIIGGLGYAYWNYLLNPLIKTYNQKKQILVEKKKDLKDAKEMVLKYDLFLQRATIITKRLDFINKRLPETFNISDIIKDVTEKAAMANIKVISFKPETKEIEKGNYKEIQINMDLVTNYINLGNFLTNLGYIERLLSPINPTIDFITEDESGNNIKVNLMLKVYLFKK